MIRPVANSTVKWRNRAAILAEFTSPLTREQSGEDLSIEWSSSDEEVIQPTLIPTSSVKINKAETHASVDTDKHSKTCILSVPGVSGQNVPPINENVQNSPGPNEEKTLLSTSFGQKKTLNTPYTQDFLPPSEHHDFTKKINNMGTSDTEKMGTRKNKLVLPVNGIGCHDEALSPSSVSDITVLEPQSPILRSRKISDGPCSPVVRTKKGQIDISSPIFGSSKVPKRKLTLCDGASAKRQLNHDVSFSSRFSMGAAAKKEEHRNVDSCHGNYVCNNYLNSDTRTRDPNDAHEAKLSTCHNQSRISENEMTQSQDRTVHLPTPPRCSRKEHSPSHSSVDLSEKIIQSGSCDSQGESKASETHFLPLALSDVSPSQGHLGLFVGDCDSQSIAVPSEGTNSQLDHNIEAPLTPCKNSFNSSDVYEDSESPLLAGAATGLLELEDNTRSGFDWVKHLHTPHKLLISEDNVDGLESSKKKLMKDGQAERLKHMLMSWRSGITLWSHELSLTAMLGMSPRQSPSVPSKVQHHTVNAGDVVKLEPEGKRNEVKPIYSSSVKNLQDLLIENSASSPETSLPSCPRKVSQKYLDLRLINVGGQLPSNAALCEALESNVEGFQASVRIKEENSEAAEKETLKKILVFFALDEHNIASLHKFDTVRVYAAWQNLSVSSHDTPALFTSYFKFHIRREDESTSISVSCNRTVLHTWTCSCSDKATALCVDKPCAFPWVSSVHTGHTVQLGVPSGFTTVKDTPDTPPQNGKLRAGTILEALEKCGGVSALPVTITIRIHRTIIRREPLDSVEFWELVGQDAAGQFCVVKIPNWPLALNLMESLNDSSASHSTYTLTHLMMTQRLTNTQNPGLFSLITSLHNAYQRSVLGDPVLQPVLQDLASCPPQTHCYLLTVSLGVTRVLNGGEQVTFPIELPHWSLQEALTVSQDGQRGSLNVYVVYKTSSSLHIVNPISQREGSPTLFSVGKKTEKGKHQDNLLISRVLLMGASLPPRMPESGPVMLSVALQDVVLWHGSVVMDEYSFMEVQDEGTTMIDVEVLNKILQPLSNLTQQDSLTLVSGTIVKIEEENAFIYCICGNCKSDKVQEAADGCVDCAGCGKKSVLPSRGYFLEVCLDCSPNLQEACVKVKLYQKTIKKLLQAYCGLQEEKYSATSLLGHQVGPMVCVLLQLQRPRRHSTCTYNLAELPY